MAAYDAHQEKRSVTDREAWFPAIRTRTRERSGPGAMAAICLVQVLVVDSPRTTVDVIEGVSRESGNWQADRAVLRGATPRCLARKWIMRKVEHTVGPRGPGTRDRARSWGRGHRSLNVWVALLGLRRRRTRPSPSWVVASPDIVETGTRRRAARRGRSDRRWSEHAREGFESFGPVFAPGDALLFDHMNLHSPARMLR